MADFPEVITFSRPTLSMTITDAARELGVSRSMLEDLIKKGEITAHQLREGGERRVSYCALLEFIRRREAAGIVR